MDANACPSFLAAMEILGKRWNGALVRAVGTSELRFVDVRDRLPGISDAILTARLNELVGCELIERTPVSSSSSRCVYGLTAKGLDLLPVLDALTAWSERWVPSTAPTNNTPSTRDLQQRAGHRP
ncbi:winged helix-turn-helix transcriptional regulator [Citricoccus sp. GCM10030269]|uniref:winged helix-turn-helix transcriptional regulator n=1 Tax=Citricoccus sp. GCM10030269 TaxID=3273388 RepID=UPI00366F3D9C